MKRTACYNNHFAKFIRAIAGLSVFACTSMLPATETFDKFVFAHYMVALPTAGPASTVDDYKAEIQAAQKAGIDGFALNCGAWSVKEPHYKERVLKLYEAARDLNTGFKLFISADFTTELSFDEFKDMVEVFRNHPNQFKHEGKPVLSTFRGEQMNLTDLVKKEFVDKKEIVLVPFYYPNPPTELPNDDEIKTLLESNSDLPGFFYFGAAGTPSEISSVSRRTAAAWLGSGKIYMAPVTPYYLGYGVNNRVFESRGFEGMAEQWKAAIESKATWIEITTWNDFSESSYVAPFGLPFKGNVWRGDWGNVLNHSAYLDASKYFIKWFKRGKPPTIKRDELFYFYRLHPKSLAGKEGMPRNAASMKDEIFVTVFLKAPARLTIENGKAVTAFELDSGVNHVSVPLSIGTPRFILSRDNKTLINKVGELAIDVENTWGNHNYFTGSAVLSPKN